MWPCSPVSKNRRHTAPYCSCGVKQVSGRRGSPIWLAPIHKINLFPSTFVSALKITMTDTTIYSIEHYYLYRVHFKGPIFYPFSELQNGHDVTRASINLKFKFWADYPFFSTHSIIISNPFKYLLNVLNPKCVCEYLEFVKTQLSVCDVQRKLSPTDGATFLRGSGGWGGSHANNHCNSEPRGLTVWSPAWMTSADSCQSRAVVTKAVNILTECQKLGKQHFLTQASLVAGDSSTVHLIPPLPPSSPHTLANFSYWGRKHPL